MEVGDSFIVGGLLDGGTVWWTGLYGGLLHGGTICLFVCHQDCVKLSLDVP